MWGQGQAGGFTGPAPAQAGVSSGDKNTAFATVCQRDMWKDDSNWEKLPLIS